MSQDEQSARNDPDFKPQQRSKAGDLCGADIEIGIQSFNDEHHRVLAQINIVCQAVLNEKPFDYLKRSLANLHTETVLHFEHEENYMKRFSYAGFDVHADDHTTLVRQLDDFIDAVTGECSTATDRLCHAKTFFKKWLLDHILEHDQAFAHFMERSGTTGPVER